MRTAFIVMLTGISLSGCIVLSGLLGASGFVLTGPAQYIGTVYAVGEYTYEYAANDKTPVQVLQEKFAWLTDDEKPEAEKDTAPVPLPRLAHARPRLAPPTRERAAILKKPATTKPEKADPTPVAAAAITAKEKADTNAAPAPLKSIPYAAPVLSPGPVQPAMLTAAAPTPQSLIKLQRMEQAFAAADAQALMSPEQPHTVRITLPPDTGIWEYNGTSEIRVRVGSLS